MKQAFRNGAAAVAMALILGGCAGGAGDGSAAASGSEVVAALPAAPTSALEFWDALEASERVTWDQLATAALLLHGEGWSTASRGVNAASEAGLLGSAGDVRPQGAVTVGDGCAVIARVLGLPASTDAQVRDAIQRFAQTGLLPQGSQPGFALSGADLIGMMGSASDERGQPTLRGS